MASSKMSALEEETHDLSHCFICMEEYDSGERKPKFLTCHHTQCLKCVKVKPHLHKVGISVIKFFTIFLTLLGHNNRCQPYLPYVQNSFPYSRRG